MSWRDHIKVHPAADLFPMMGEAELRELGEDIKAHEQQHPVILLRDGEQVWLLDGRNRLDAMELVGLPMLRQGGHWDRTYDRDFLFEEIEADGAFDPYAYVVSANIRRRHLTGADRDELVRKVKAARPELSVRAVAEITNTPKSTVARALADPSPVPLGTPAERVTGKDGKSYPAHKPGTGQVKQGDPVSEAAPAPVATTANVEVERPLSPPVEQPEDVPEGNPLIAAWERATREQQEDFLRHLAGQGWSVPTGPAAADPVQQPGAPPAVSGAPAQDSAPAGAAAIPCNLPNGCRYGGCAKQGRCMVKSP